MSPFERLIHKLNTPPLPEYRLHRIGLRPETKDYIIGNLDAKGELLAGKPKALFRSDPKEDKDLVNRRVPFKYGRKPKGAHT